MGLKIGPPEKDNKGCLQEETEFKHYQNDGIKMKKTVKTKTSFKRLLQKGKDSVRDKSKKQITKDKKVAASKTVK